MQIKVINKRTGTIDTYWTRKYNDALNNDYAIQIPHYCRLTVGNTKKQGVRI